MVCAGRNRVKWCAVGDGGADGVAASARLVAEPEGDCTAGEAHGILQLLADRIEKAAKAAELEINAL